MKDVLITEHAGTLRAEISRFYQYGSGGVRVLDTRKIVKRLYLFDSSSDIMTERDPRRQEKTLRRFVFDKYGMLEETFAFGESPRTFRYEDGGRQIAVREGGDYGAVGKIITFEPNGITETAWGRNGEIEYVYQFDAKGDAITIRAGGWYGDVKRTIVFTGMGASLFLEPESFLQFLMFTEWSAKDRDEDINERVAQIRGGEAASPGKNPYAYTGIRHIPTGMEDTGRREQVPQRSARTSWSGTADTGIDFIPDSDAPVHAITQRPGPRRSSDITFEERFHRDQDGRRELLKGKSAEIPLEERFESSYGEPEKLLKGGSAEIPLGDRFESSAREQKKLPKGKSTEIPYSERKGGRDH
jgi:hypothetical protein